MATIPSCRTSLPCLQGARPASHPGLILSRYLAAHDKEESRKNLWAYANRALNSAVPFYREAFTRRQNWIGALPSTQTDILTVDPSSRLVIGLGNESPLETGLTLHPTYGTPFIPGSALKGVSSHYCDAVWGEQNEKFKKSHPSNDNYHRVLFGNTEDAGRITFHDAWWVPGDSGFLLDVMTPHHQDYYGQVIFTGGPAPGRRIPPSDFDEPIPITFLSVGGQFHFALTSDDQSEEGSKWLRLAFDLLGQALFNWGVGGKTSSGYGRFKIQELIKLEAIRTKQFAPGATSAHPDQIPSSTNKPEKWAKAKLIYVKGNGMLRAEFQGHKTVPLAIGKSTIEKQWSDLWKKLNKGAAYADLEVNIEGNKIDIHAINGKPIRLD